MKILLWITATAIVLIGGFFVLSNHFFNEKAVGIERPPAVAVQKALFYLTELQPLDNNIEGYDIDRDPFPRDMLYADGGYPSDEKFFSKADVERHNLTSDCWIIDEGKVHDVTGLFSYTEAHPAIGTLIRLCGTDITQAKRTSPVEPGSLNTARVQYALSPLYIGHIEVK
ncbi:hypothetical protein H7X87_00605 [Acetobacteraceae bacterium]|nr:hypothetical protein [Candidatus Parcubacteria bacterium]